MPSAFNWITDARRPRQILRLRYQEVELPVSVSIDVPLLSMDAVIFTPEIITAQVLAMPFLTADSVIFTPDLLVTEVLNFPFLTTEQTIFTPDWVGGALLLAMPFLTFDSELFVPSLVETLGDFRVDIYYRSRTVKARDSVFYNVDQDIVNELSATDPSGTVIEIDYLVGASTEQIANAGTDFDEDWNTGDFLAENATKEPRTALMIEDEYIPDMEITTAVT